VTGYPAAPPVPRTSERLTAGWRGVSSPAGLAEHEDRFGPVPRRGSGRSRGGLPWLATAAADAGLTGRGGGGFPVGRKMLAVAASRGRAVVVANGMESEPASRKDEALLSLAPHLVLDGAVLAAEAVGATAIHLCLSRLRPGLADQLQVAVAERARTDPLPVQVHAVPHHYVSSEETALVRWLNGGEAKPVMTPPRPHERGVARQPTLVSNVETLAHLALIARYGPQWFRQAGLPEAPGTMLVTTSGAVSLPGVREIEAGTAVGGILAQSGVSDHAAAVLVGGYFGTWHDRDAIAGVPLAAHGLARAGGSPGAGVLVALPATACGITETARVLAYLAGQSAGQCGPCTFGLPAIAEDFAQLATGRVGEGLFERLERRLGTVRGRGACRHPDGATRLAASALITFAADAHAHARRRPCAAARSGGPGVLPIGDPAAGEAWR
jgi:NADH:ubiquinone oxidoreductase subunit F (NADH-binding)